MIDSTTNPFPLGLFRCILRHPRILFVVLFCLFSLLVSGLFRLQIEPDTDAFLPKKSTAIELREHIKALFGVSDPILVMVHNDGKRGIFEADTLNLVAHLTETIIALPEIEPRQVSSLVTEENIYARDNGILFEPFWQGLLQTQQEAERVRDAVYNCALYVDVLVTEDGQSTLIVIEPGQTSAKKDLYPKIEQIVNAVPAGNTTLYLTGHGAVSAALGASIQSDMKRFNVLCGLVITVVLLLSYRTLRGLVLPMLVVGGTVGMTLGLMGWLGEPIYVITNALPVILIAIGVADSIHFLGQYYEEVAYQPGASPNRIVAICLEKLWRPITITTLTDVAGFLTIYFSSDMPPMKAFGLFAALGVLSAWVLSLTLLPAILSHLPLQRSRAYRKVQGAIGMHTCSDNSGDLLALSKSKSAGSTATGLSTDGFGLSIMRLGSIGFNHPRLILGMLVPLGIAIYFGAIQLQIDEERVRNFEKEHPIYTATQAVNREFEGIHFLDILIETPDEEDLFLPENLAAIEAFENYLLTLPQVGGTVSYLDFLRQMNKAANEDRPEAFHLPESEALAAQFFLIQSVGGNAESIEDLIDFDYRKANLRVKLKTGQYTQAKIVHDAAIDYVEKHFNNEERQARLSGRVNVDYHWLKNLADNHFHSVFLALVAIWLTLTWSYRSGTAALITALPVIMAVLVIYAIMGYTRLWLNVGTSMFAAIAIGCGVDFSVHIVDRMRHLYLHANPSPNELLHDLFASTGRALLFNFMAIFLGFSLLMTSEVPPLVHFGVLITASVSVSFVMSLIVLPALIAVLGSGIILPKRQCRGGVSVLLCTLLVVGLLMPWQLNASADEPKLDNAYSEWTGIQIAERINERDSGECVARKLKFTMISKKGKKRERETVSYRKESADELKTVIFYESPKNVKGTAFLNIDYSVEDQDDDRWLYLPALRKVRRIAASERGDYFLGTDFSYDDISHEAKVSLKDYVHQNVGTEVWNGAHCLLLQGIPRNETIAEELGYGKVLVWVDPGNWMLRKVEYWDVQQVPLKTVTFEQIEKIQGIWTAHRLHAVNHQNGHQTILKFDEVDYKRELDDTLFMRNRLNRGP